MPHPNQSFVLVHTLIDLIRTSPDSPTMLSEIAVTLAKEFQSDTCLLVAGINGQEQLQTAFWSQDSSTLIPAQLFETFISQSFIGELQSQSEPFAIANRQGRDNGVMEDLLLEMLPLESLLAIGTRFRRTVNGLIVIGYTKPHQWTEQEKNLLKITAETVAIAHSLIHPLPPSSDGNTRRDSPPNPNTRNVSVDDPILKLWYEATRKQLEQQRQLNEQLIHNIITTMSDQTRNPLAIMRMGIEMLRRTQLSPESQKQRLDILEQEWHKLNDINEKILQLKTLKSQSLTFHPKLLKLKPWLKDFTQSYQEQWQQDSRKPLNLELEVQPATQTKSAKTSSLTINTDSEHLKTILKELLTNAGKFSLANTTVMLTLTQEVIAKKQKIVIAVTNESRCIAPENVKYLFEPFYREQRVIDEALPGIGLGLTIIKELVQLLQGEIKIVCTPTADPESCTISFKLILPQSLA